MKDLFPSNLTSICTLCTTSPAHTFRPVESPTKNAEKSEPARPWAIPDELRRGRSKLTEEKKVQVSSDSEDTVVPSGSSGSDSSSSGSSGEETTDLDSSESDSSDDYSLRQSAETESSISEEFYISDKLKPTKKLYSRVAKTQKKPDCYTEKGIRSPAGSPKKSPKKSPRKKVPEKPPLKKELKAKQQKKKEKPKSETKKRKRDSKSDQESPKKKNKTVEKPAPKASPKKAQPKPKPNAVQPTAAKVEAAKRAMAEKKVIAETQSIKAAKHDKTVLPPVPQKATISSPQKPSAQRTSQKPLLNPQSPSKEQDGKQRGVLRRSTSSTPPGTATAPPPSTAPIQQQKPPTIITAPRAQQKTATTAPAQRPVLQKQVPDTSKILLKKLSEPPTQTIAQAAPSGPPTRPLGSTTKLVIEPFTSPEVLDVKTQEKILQLRQEETLRIEEFKRIAEEKAWLLEQEELLARKKAQLLSEEAKGLQEVRRIAEEKANLMKRNEEARQEGLLGQVQKLAETIVAVSMPSDLPTLPQLSPPKPFIPENPKERSPSSLPLPISHETPPGAVEIRGLSHTVSNPEAQTLFEKYGTVVSMTRTPKVLTIEYQDPHCAIDAIFRMNNTEHRGHTLSVSLPKSLADQEPTLLPATKASPTPTSSISTIPQYNPPHNIVYGSGFPAPDKSAIQALFSKYGPIKNIGLSWDPNGMFGGTTRIEYQTSESVAQAVKHLNLSCYGGNIIRVTVEDPLPQASVAFTPSANGAQRPSVTLQPPQGLSSCNGFQPSLDGYQTLSQHPAVPQKLPPPPNPLDGLSSAQIYEQLLQQALPLLTPQHPGYKPDRANPMVKANLLGDPNPTDMDIDEEVVEPSQSSQKKPHAYPPSSKNLKQKIPITNRVSEPPKENPFFTSYCTEQPEVKTEPISTPLPVTSQPTPQPTLHTTHQPDQIMQMDLDEDLLIPGHRPQEKPKSRPTFSFQLKPTTSKPETQVEQHPYSTSQAHFQAWNKKHPHDTPGFRVLPKDRMHWQPALSASGTWVDKTNEPHVAPVINPVQQQLPPESHPSPRPPEPGQPAYEEYRQWVNQSYETFLKENPNVIKMDRTAYETWLVSFWYPQQT